MSTAADVDPRRSNPGVRLRLVAPLVAERVGRGTFTLMAVALLAIGLTAILLVNTTVAQGGFALGELRAEQAELAQRRQVLEAELALAASPASLETKAQALGMIQSKSPAFLRVPDGKVIGKATPARSKKSAPSGAEPVATQSVPSDGLPVQG